MYLSAPSGCCLFTRNHLHIYCPRTRETTPLGATHAPLHEQLYKGHGVLATSVEFFSCTGSICRKQHGGDDYSPPSKLSCRCKRESPSIFPYSTSPHIPPKRTRHRRKVRCKREKNPFHISLLSISTVPPERHVAAEREGATTEASSRSVSPRFCQFAVFGMKCYGSFSFAERQGGSTILRPSNRGGFFPCSVDAGDPHHVAKSLPAKRNNMRVSCLLNVHGCAPVAAITPAIPSAVREKLSRSSPAIPCDVGGVGGYDTSITRTKSMISYRDGEAGTQVLDPHPCTVAAKFCRLVRGSSSAPSCWL